MESLTDQIEEKARELLTKIDALGGAVAAIEQRFYQNEITKSAYQYQLAIERKEKIVVGVNEFISEPGMPAELLRIDERVGKEQIGRLHEIRRSRNAGAVVQALTDFRNAAAGTANLIPHIQTCVEAYASVGEISDALRAVWGEYKE